MHFFFSKLLSGWKLAPSASTYGPAIDHLYSAVLWITGTAFLLTEGALIYFLLRYRRRPGRAASPVQGNPILVTVWTVIPAAILIFMAALSQSLWLDIRSPKIAPKADVRVRVLAEQWLWQFTYPGPDGVFGTPDDITVENIAHIPVGQTVEFDLASRDVIHGFYVPDLRVHQDALPGSTGHVWVRVTRTGTFEVRCAQFCGVNHYQMKGELVADRPDDFKAWLASAQASAF